MQTNHDILTYLIAHPGASRAIKRASASAAPATLQGLLLSGLYKRAQALGEASKGVQHRFVQSMREQDARRQQEAAKAEARRNAAPNWGLTGDKDYDNLPDVKERREKQYMDNAFDNYYSRRKDLIQKKDPAAVAKEVGPVQSWGDTTVGKAVGDFFGNTLGRVVDWAGKGIGYYTNAAKGTTWDEWSKMWDETANTQAKRDKRARDIANNLQLWGEGVSHGAGTVGRWAQRIFDPRAYGSSLDAKLRQREYANMRANAAAEHEARVNGIINNFNDSQLRDTSSGIGKWNNITTEGLGEVLGGELATAGFGGAAGAIGKGVMRGTRVVSGAVRGAQAANAAANAAGAAANAAGTAANVAGRGARFVQGARNMAARGIDAIGDTVATPFNMVGTLASPAATGRAVASGARDVGHTVWNAAKPVRDIYGLIRHPQMSMAAFRATPYTHVWNGITYVPRWAWNTGKPIGRHAFSDQGFKATTALGAINSMSNGDYGSALGSLGVMGGYGALGSAMIPIEYAGDMFWGGEE